MPDTDLPQIGSSITADEGVTSVRRAVQGRLGWLFREQSTHDFGIDGHIEVAAGEPRVATGRLISAQIKAGDSYFGDADEVGWRVYIPRRTVNYWFRGSLPHILILVRPSGECFWTAVTPASPRLQETADGFRITVPRNQRLDASARDALLDLDSGPFVGTERYFGVLLDRDRAFHHARPLVGRDRELNEIVSADPAELVVFEVAGRVGIGKTRLLLEAARRRHDAAWACRWVRDHVEVTAAAARQLPPGPLLLIADDVHLRSDLSAICDLAKGRREPTVLVLGLRPWARPLVRSAVAAASIPLDSVRSIHLGELRRSPLIFLLRGELGPSLQQHAETLASQLGDSTLVALAGARFLREEQRAPALLERSAAFRHEVLTRFEDAVLGDFSGRVDRAGARALLRLISVSGPVQADDPEWVRSAAEFLGIPVYELMELVGIMEAGEVLVRRDARVRVSPDVLADHLVHAATLTETGRLSGYPQSLLDNFGPAVLPHLVRNLAELDWRLGAVGEAAPVLEEVWDRFRATLPDADNFGRLQLLYGLRPVAAIQPGRVYELCRWLVDHPTGEAPGSPLIGDSRVREATLPLLAEILDDEDFFTPVATLMYRIGRDRRTTDPFSELANRVAYPQQPGWVREKLAECLEAWTAEPDWADHAQSPLVLAERCLRKEEVLVVPRGRAFHIGAQPVPTEPTDATRLRVIRLLGKLARGSSPRGRILAVDTLLAALAQPSRSLGRTVTDEEGGWLQHDLAAVAELNAAASGPDPLVRIRVRDRLLDLDARYHAAVAAAARTAAEAMGETDETSLYRAWSGTGRSSRTTRRGTTGRRPRVRAQRMAYMRTVARWLAAGRNTSEIVEHMLSADFAYSAAGLDARPDALLDAIASVAPDVAIGVAHEIADRGGPLAGRIGALLNGIARVRRRSYRPLLADFVRAGGPALRSVAGALARAAFERAWTAYESDYAPSLAASDDAVVRGHILHAVAAGSVPSPLGLAVLSAATVGRDLWLGELFASAADVVLDRAGGIADRSAAAGLLQKLAGVPRFAESDAVTRFLTNVASRWPDLVIEFVVERIRLMETANRVDAEEADEEERPRALYRAVPRGDWSQVWTAVRASQGYRNALAGIRDESARTEGDSKKEILHVFHELADVDDQTADAILEWIESGDVQLVEAAIPLLEQLPHAFAFARPGFVARALDAAFALGTSPGAGVSLALGDSLQPRIGFRGDEYVRHLEWVRQRATTCAAEVQSEQAARFYHQIAGSAASAALAQTQNRDDDWDDLDDVEAG